MKKSIWLIIVTLLFACGNQQEDGSYAAAESNMKMTTLPSNSLAKENPSFSSVDKKQKPDAPISMKTPEFNRKIIKKADYKFEVDDVDQSTLKMHELAEQFSGFVSSMNLSTSSTSMNNRLTIKVMNEQFEPLLTALSKEAIFVYHKRIQSQDVTEQFVDLESRLNVKKQVKDRYIEMLRKDAKTMQQVLQAEEKIRILQEEIESKEGRLRFLGDQVSLSEIQLELVQEVEYQEKLQVKNKSFAQKATNSFLNGWNSILNVTLNILNYWHLGLLVSLIWLGRGSVFDLAKRFINR